MKNETNQLSYRHRKERQIALREFLTSLNFPCFATINYNRKEFSHREAKKTLCELQKRLEQAIFGRRFYKLPPSERLFFIAMPEHMNGNFHHHLLMRLPPERALYILLNAWFHLRQILPGATIMIKRLATADDVRATSFYSCKDSWNEENFNKFVISTEFASYKKKHPSV